MIGSVSMLHMKKNQLMGLPTNVHFRRLPADPIQYYTRMVMPSLNLLSALNLNIFEQFQRFNSFLIPIVLIILAVICSSTSLAASSPRTAYQSAKKCYHRVTHNRHNKKDRNAWAICIDQFEEIADDFPESSQSPKALFSAAKLRNELYKTLKHKEDARLSIELYNKVVKKYPDHSLSDDSLYHIALLRHDPLSQTDRSKKALNYLISHYPEGDMLAKARTLLATFEIAQAAKTPVAESAKYPITEKEHVVAQNPIDTATTTTNQTMGVVLNDILVSDLADQTTVELIFNDDASYTVEFTEKGLRTKSPPKLALTFTKAIPSDSIERELIIGSPYLNNIHIKSRLWGKGSRIIFELSHDANYKLNTDKKKLILSFKQHKSAKTSKVNSGTKKKSIWTSLLDPFKFKKKDFIL